MRSSQGVSRRELLAAAATISFLSMAGAAVASSPRKQTTFILVHGAWHGGWCWTKLTPLLRAAGHEVFVPTLTGMGERSHLLTSEIGLDTHVTDVAAVLEYEDLHDVVLVGHSYGGMVITGVAEAAGVRLARLVYVDAFLPENGKALKDYAPVPPTREDGWRIPPPGAAPRFDVADERDVAWMEARLGDQPLKTFIQPVVATSGTHESLSRTFIQCSQAPWFAEAAERGKRQGFQSYEMLSAGHDVMITQAAELATILGALD